MHVLIEVLLFMIAKFHNHFSSGIKVSILLEADLHGHKNHLETTT